jgi:hypothetical protein
MAVPASGELKLWDSIWNQEIGGAQGENSLHSASVYAGFSTPDALSDFYGWSDVEVPTVTTYSALSVTDSSMCPRVCVNTTGGEDPVYGVYFGTNAGDYASNTKYTGGTGGVGLYNISRTGLSYLTTYYFWAFACNSGGEAVGSRLSAATTAPPYTPTFGSTTCIQGVAGTQGFCSYMNVSTAYQNPYTSAWNTKCSCVGCFDGNLTATWYGVGSSTNSCNRVFARSQQAAHQVSATNRRATLITCANTGLSNRVIETSPGGNATCCASTNVLLCAGNNTTYTCNIVHTAIVYYCKQ